MQEITNIIVPIDLEIHTQKLVDYALFIAQKMNAQVHFIHSVESYVLGDMMMGASSLEKINREREQKAKDVMTDLVKDNKTTYADIEGFVWKGEPSETIIKYAEEVAADMVIIGTHGTKGLDRILLGSVAERVLKGVHCPTLTMNPYR